MVQGHLRAEEVLRAIRQALKTSPKGLCCRHVINRTVNLRGVQRTTITYFRSGVHRKVPAPLALRPLFRADRFALPRSRQVERAGDAHPATATYRATGSCIAVARCRQFRMALVPAAANNHGHPAAQSERDPPTVLAPGVLQWP